MNQYISAFISSLGVLSVGCTVGWTTPVLKKLKQKGSVLPITEDEGSWLAATHEFGHFLSPIPSGLLINKVGRTKCLMVGAFLHVIGWILVLTTKSISVLYFVRFLFGLSMGIVFTTVPIYIGELAPSKTRGALSTLFQAMLYLGHLIEFSSGPYVSYMTLGIISLCISLIWLLSSFFLKESPYYLVKNDENLKARKTISWLLRTSDDEIIENKLHQIQTTVETSQEATFKDLILYRRKVITVMLVAVAQRFTGMSAVVAYAASTFPSSENGLNSDQYTILFGALIFGFTFVSAALIDSMGRRPLIIISCLGCSISHLVTCIYFGITSSQVTWLPFVSICSFSILYSLGLGPIVNTLQGELFPNNIKGPASSMVTIAHAASSFIVTKIFQVIRDSYGIYVNFLIFSISCCISTLFAYYMVPETKRKELQETEKLDN